MGVGCFVITYHSGSDAEVDDQSADWKSSVSHWEPPYEENSVDSVPSVGVAPKVFSRFGSLLVNSTPYQPGKYFGSL